MDQEACQNRDVNAGFNGLRRQVGIVAHENEYDHEGGKENSSRESRHPINQRRWMCRLIECHGCRIFNDLDVDEPPLVHLLEHACLGLLLPEGAQRSLQIVTLALQSIQGPSGFLNGIQLFVNTVDFLL